MSRRFPDGFLWGLAASAYQIEGAVAEDGRMPSAWDDFVRRPFHVLDGSTGDIACDHYHRMPEDVALMRTLGVGAYRFSVSWPRVIPSGRGPVNATGLDFYERLVDELLEAAIAPYLTLEHWDHPATLETAGGWRGRAMVDAFVDYAEVLYRRLGDRVAGWITHNEPWCLAFLGHGTAIHSPGWADQSAAYQVAHHLLLAHGRAVSAFRASGATGLIGISLNPQWYLPASDGEADLAARARVWANSVELFLDPIIHGRYPAALLDWIGPHAPRVEPGDLEAINVPIDFLGVNYYNAERISWAVDGGLLRAASMPYSESGWGRSAMGWGIAPSGLGAVLRELDAEYPGLALVVTENGVACDDRSEVDDRVDDQDRIAYLRAHLDVLAETMASGVDVRGYFHWSLLDNFEWTFGYTRTFGLVRVEPGSLRRIPKASADWYAEVVRSNGRRPA